MMSFFRVLTFNLLLIVTSVVHAQPELKVEEVYFSGEPVSAVSVGSNGVWVVKGEDSLGLGKVDFSGNSFDYSANVKGVINTPLTDLIGKYRDEALLSTSNNLYWFKDGEVAELDTAKAGIYGSKILGISGTPGFTEILTDSNLFSSYDNNLYSPTTNFKSRFPKIIGLENHSLVFLGSPRCYNPNINTEEIQVYYKLGAGVYVQSFRYIPNFKIFDFTFTKNFPHLVYLGHDKGLMAGIYGCTGINNYFQDTAVFSVQTHDSHILIGTEKGLYYSEEMLSRGINRLDLPVGDCKVFDIEIEAENNIVWVGTDKGLCKIKYVKKDNSGEFLLKTDWKNQVGGRGTDETNGIAADEEGNVYITGTFTNDCKFGDTSFIAKNSKDFFLAKYSNPGRLKWVKSALTEVPPGTEINEEGRDVCTDSEGNIYVAGHIRVIAKDNEEEKFRVSFGESFTEIGKVRSFLVKYDSNGDLLWERFFDANFNYRISVKADEEGNTYLLQSLHTTNGLGLSGGYAVVKHDENGNFLWGDNFPEVHSIEAGKSGNFYIGGEFNGSLSKGQVTLSSSQDHVNYLLYINKDGIAVTGIKIEGERNNSHMNNINSISHDSYGNVYLSGYKNGRLIINDSPINDTSTDRSSFFIKFNQKGKVLWARRYNNSHSFSEKFVTDSLGFSVGSGFLQGNFLYGEKTFNSVSDRNSFLVKIDPYGNIVWFNQYLTNRSYQLDRGVDNVTLGPDNNIYGAVYTGLDVVVSDESDYISYGGTDIFLFKVYDSLNINNFSLVKGRVFNDKNSDLKFNAEEEGLSGIILKAQPGERYSYTNEDGFYEFYLRKGEYAIEQIIPSGKGLLVTQNYPENNGKYSISIPEEKIDTAGFDFADHAKFSPYLTVDVNSIRRRRCFRGNTKVKYCNEGFKPANDAKVTVELPEYIVPVSTDVPWSAKDGKTLTFDVGTIPEGTCGTIIITDSVQCGDESILGLTQCTKAIISPPNNIVPENPDWDKADLELKGTCADNGYIRVSVINKGTGNMSDSSHFRIILDTTVIFNSNIKLVSGDSLSLNIPANGKFLRAEAEQTANHPSGEIATVNIEGCKKAGEVAVSKGFINQYGTEDKKEEVEVSCMEIIGSYDPNDKQVIPAGITEHHNIKEGSRIEYILRFMNKGTDTAFTVRIVDTLSSLLDISTFNPGITSHACNWNISGKENPVITCTFNNINLPDSVTNEQGSQGYAKFTINHKNGIKGKQIRNKAYIYFDYNSPVITNEVLSTVGLPDLPQKRISYQLCNNTNTSGKNDSLAIALCGDNYTEVPVVKNDTTFSFWQYTNGVGQVVQKSDSIAAIRDIPAGNYMFKHVHQYCDLSWNNVVLVNRTEIPGTPSDIDISYCEGSKLDSLRASGSNIVWYYDSNLTFKAGEGRRFLPDYGISDTLYITQSENNCESEAGVVKVKYKNRPLPPSAFSYSYCLKDPEKYIKAQGENVTWYYDTLSFKEAGKGDKLIINELASGDSVTFFATQSKNGCESLSSPASISVRPFNLNEVYIPNYLTSTGQNYFSLPKFETNNCVGEFEFVRVFDVSGKQVYFSTSEDFKWYPANTGCQIMLYQVKYSDQLYKGKLIVGGF